MGPREVGSDAAPGRSLPRPWIPLLPITRPQQMVAAQQSGQFGSDEAT